MMRGRAVRGPAGQGALLLSSTVYYSKRGIWLGEETGGQLARREAGLAERCSPVPTLSPACLWGGCAPRGLRSLGPLWGLCRRGGRLPASLLLASPLASALSGSVLSPDESQATVPAR